MKAKERMQNRILAHGEDLLKIFPDTSTDDPMELCRKVHRIETKAHRLATDWCNGDIDNETWEKETDRIKEALDKILHFRDARIPVFTNGDARGYTLKIASEYVTAHDLHIHKDWGGYGIIAPEFDGKS